MYFDSKVTSALAIGGALLVLSLFLKNSKSASSTMLGGKKDVDVHDTNSLEIDEIANFAVSEHNNRQVRELGVTWGTLNFNYSSV